MYVGTLVFGTMLGEVQNAMAQLRKVSASAGAGEKETRGAGGRLWREGDGQGGKGRSREQGGQEGERACGASWGVE
eukprot:675867-Rhodomonas_salina.1